MISFSQSVYSINYFLLLQLKQGGRGEGGGGSVSSISYFLLLQQRGGRHFVFGLACDIVA